uniref:Uncharacterized protein n=1 Tax=Arion vulgaris TaxID=1028688 RepID=A0A0B7ADT0_9EUPU
MVRRHTQVTNRQCATQSNIIPIQWIQSKMLTIQKVDLRDNRGDEGHYLGSAHKGPF